MLTNSGTVDDNKLAKHQKQDLYSIFMNSVTDYS